jgi:N-acetylglucosaminyldiphosphoundecaprenol N-acetyl-beta-D-mannosaminyltransferase
MSSNIFGLSVDSRSASEVADEICERTAAGLKSMVVTPNVDHFLRWQRDNHFRKLYNEADFCLADGMPIVWLAKLLATPNCNRITGVDFTLEILARGEELNLPVAIIGGTDSVLELAKANLILKYPKIDVFLMESPSTDDLNDSEYLLKLSSKLSVHSYKIVLLCLGSPKQEQLYLDLTKIKKQRGAYLCVGATVDFLAGAKKRAPKILQALGLEWAFRFLQEPKRLFRRYFLNNSQIVFYFVKAFWLKFKSVYC